MNTIVKEVNVRIVGVLVSVFIIVKEVGVKIVVEVKSVFIIG